MKADNTSDRIVTAALSLFIKQGVKKTNLEEVAFQAGVTRITVYRCFGEKNRLVQAACMKIASIFQQIAEEGPAERIEDIDNRLSRLGVELNQLPPGNVLAWLEEVSRLYPQIYQEFRSTRQMAVDRIFQQALEAAAKEGTLREELHTDVLKAIFLTSVLGLIENPTLITSNVPLSVIFATVTEVFRRGILKESPSTACLP